MSLTYGFFNSVNGDRKYNAEQMSEYFRGIINEGVYQNLDGGLAVTAGTGLAVSVASGRAIVQNRWVQNSESLSLTISSPSEVYARKDAVVIRLNWSSRLISIAVKTGTPAASPVAPSMTRDSATYEMALAYVNVAANATSVTVTDKRSDSTVCGWVTVAQSTSGEVDAQLNAMKTGFDGVTYDSPVAMVQSCDQKLQGEIDDVIGYPYQYNFEWIEGQSINGSTGAVVDPDATWHRSDYIDISSVDAIYISTNMSVDNSSNALYDANKQFSRNVYISANSDKASFPLQSNEKYIRVSCAKVRTIQIFPKFNSLKNKVDKTTTVNGHALSGNVSVTKSDVGLGNVDNTSDINKPVSTATQNAINNINGFPLIYPIEWNNGGSISSITGDVDTSQTSWKYSNYIELANAEEIYISTTRTLDNSNNAFYDENKNFLGMIYIYPNANNQKIDYVPYNAKYVRVSCGQAQQITIIPTFSSVNDLSNIIESINGYPFEVLFGWHTGEINGSDGSVISTSTTWHYSDFIEIDERGFYVSSTMSSTIGSNAFYNDQKEYISGLEIPANADKVFINQIPQGAKYIRVSCGNSRRVRIYPPIIVIKDLYDRIKDLEERQDDSLPSYYNSYMPTKNATVNEKMDAIANCVSFVFFTDPHVGNNAQNSGAMIGNILKNTGVKDVVCGGDIISAYGNETVLYTDCKTYKTKWGFLNPYYVRGNHDIYDKTTENTNTGFMKQNPMVINRFMRPFHDDMIIPDGKTYYYFDRPQNKVRFIVLDTTEVMTSEVVDNVWNPVYSITQTQVNWFINLLNDTPDGYKIVLLSHIPLTNQLPEYYGKALIFGDILEAFNNKTTINKTDSYGITASADFTSSNGIIIISLCGHHHNDGTYTSSSGCVYYEVDSDSLLNNGGSQYDRNEGTTSEQAFDVIIINVDTGRIESIRYGAGQDKVLATGTT